METRAAGLSESNRAKADAEEFQLIVTQFLRENAGISDDAPVVRDFLFQNTHTVSGLGGGGRSAGYLHVCAAADLDHAKAYRVTTVDRSPPVVGCGIAYRKGVDAHRQDRMNRKKAQKQLEDKEKSAPAERMASVTARVGG